MSSTVAALLAAAMMLLPLPFVVVAPGYPYDLTSDDSELLLSVEGVPTYPSEGSTHITTVELYFGSDNHLTLGNIVRAWIQRDNVVYPETVFDVPGGDVEATARQDWLTSQERAAVSALEHLDYEVPVVVTVVEIQEESRSHGLLEVGDVILAASGQRIEAFGDLAGELGEITPGDPVTVTIERGGEMFDVTFDTIDDGNGGAVMGVWVNPDFTLPVAVEIADDQVGGPSAGLMFALAIMQSLTPEDESEGIDVSGTGTIDIDGDVGPIGGIRQKMAGAADIGVEWFFAPVENCDEVVGWIPEGLGIVAVDDLDDAYTALIAIGEGATSSLPTCDEVWQAGSQNPDPNREESSP